MVVVGVKGGGDWRQRGGGFAVLATEKCMRWKIVRTRIPWKIDSPPSNNKNTGMAMGYRGQGMEKQETAWIPVIEE
jgi:hypothetical protein